MGDLKPLGSERLQGIDKINRIIEIATYNQKNPTVTNESTSSEYKVRLADNNVYYIDREKNGYIIKYSITETAKGYIEPIENRRYYSSYSQALKRLNIIARELNDKYGNESGTNLFYEQKKYTLRTPKPKTAGDDIENVPAPMAPTPGGVPDAVKIPTPPQSGPQNNTGGVNLSPPPAPGGDEFGGSAPMPGGEDFGGDEFGGEDFGGEDFGGGAPMPGGDEFGGDEFGGEDFGGEDHDENISFKTIQKITGKLSQKLRDYSSDNEMSSKDIKYVVNSVLSALDLSNLDEDDLDDIMSKFDMTPDEDYENDEFDFSGEESDYGGDEFESEEYGYEGDNEGMPAPFPTSQTAPPQMPNLGESTWGDFADDVVKNTALKYLNKKATNENRRRDDKIVENLISKYFVTTESEKKFNRQLNQDRASRVIREIENAAESRLQENSAKNFVNRNRGVTFVGKSNKSNLIFEMNGQQYKVTPKGSII